MIWLMLESPASWQVVEKSVIEVSLQTEAWLHVGKEMQY